MQGQKLGKETLKQEIIKGFLNVIDGDLDCFEGCSYWTDGEELIFCDRQRAQDLDDRFFKIENCFDLNMDYSLNIDWNSQLIEQGQNVNEFVADYLEETDPDINNLEDLQDDRGQWEFEAHLFLDEAIDYFRNDASFSYYELINAIEEQELETRFEWAESNFDLENAIEQNKREIAEQS